jgi:hypothetical protein
MGGYPDAVNYERGDDDIGGKGQDISCEPQRRYSGRRGGRGGVCDDDEVEYLHYTTEASEGRKKGKYDYIVVLTPKHPAAVDENQVTDEICERDKEICAHKTRSLRGKTIDSC